MNDSAEQPQKRRSGDAKRMGRPPKSAQILERMAIAYAPESIYPLLFEIEGKDARWSKEKLVVPDFEELYLKVRKKLETILGQASSRDGISKPTHDALAKLRERVPTVPPESLLKACNQEMEINERLISGLVGHLINHIIVGEELRSIADTARSRVEDGLKTVAPVYLGFVRRLEAAGVVENNVRDMSTSQFARVLAALKGTSSDEQMQVISQILEERNVIREIFKQSFEDGVAPGEQVAPSVVAPEPEEISLAVIGGDADDGFAIADAAAENTIVDDPGLWDNLDLEPIGYRIEEVEPSTAADIEALGIKLPETSVFSDMSHPSTTEHSDMQICVHGGSRGAVENVLRRHSNKTETPMSQMEMRILAMLLVDYQREPGKPLIGVDGWFDGIVLPPRPGSSMVRRVVSINQAPHALVNAYRP